MPMQCSPSQNLYRLLLYEVEFSLECLNLLVELGLHLLELLYAAQWSLNAEVELNLWLSA